MTTRQTSLRRDPRALWAAARGPLFVAATVVVLAGVLAVFTETTTRGLLDPNAVDEQGSRAIVELLRDRDVRVEVARTAAEVRGLGPDATVLVPFPDDLTPVQFAALRGSTADLVLVQPSTPALRELAPTVTLTAITGEAGTRPPGCGLPAAQRAGVVELWPLEYTAPGAVACYPGLDGAGLVQVPDGQRTITVLGGTDMLTNGTLAEEGNAALGMNLLGADPELVWFSAVPEGVPEGQQRSFGELVPPGIRSAAGMLVVAVVLAVLWRARRLGPVVAEPLPVVVRAAEATEGRARLYRRARARGHAAEVLRDAARARLGGLSGVPGPLPDRRALVAAVASRTARPAGEIDGLLYGPAPVDDSSMIELVRALDACEAEVRRA